MKALTFLLFITLLISCNFKQKRPEPGFYKNLYTNEIISQSEFDLLTEKIFQDNFDSTPKNTAINYQFYDL